jgi:hypothetical protein
MSDTTGAMVRYIDKGIVSEKKMPPTATFLMLHGNPTWSFVHRVERAIRLFSPQRGMMVDAAKKTTAVLVQTIRGGR